MKPINIRVPQGSEIANYLYPEMDLDDLDQDLITVRLPSGYFVDVGWYPEHDPRGRFVTRVFQGAWDNQKLDKTLETRNISELIFNVETLAEHFSRPNLPTSQTGGFRITVPAVGVAVLG
jgi:hypothetical protein